jgi:hypothetical protein
VAGRAAATRLEWIPERLADEQHAQAVAAHRPISRWRDERGSRGWKAPLGCPDRAGIAAAILAATTVKALLSLLIGVFAIAPAGAAHTIDRAVPARRRDRAAPRTPRLRPRRLPSLPTRIRPHAILGLV